MTTARTAASFRRRLMALGYTTPVQAAGALGLERTGVWRAWTGRRPVSPAAWAATDALEAAQPAPLTLEMRRVLAGAEPTKGAPVSVPAARNNIERGIDWRPVFDALAALGLITWWRERPMLTELGARAVTFLHERGLK